MSATRDVKAEEFVLISKAGLPFFRPPKEAVIEELDKKKAEELNQASSSYSQFKFTDDEVDRLARCEAAGKDIADKINELGRQEIIEEQKRKALLFCDDVVLREILEKKFPRYKSNIICTIDRTDSKNLLCRITFKDTEAGDAVKKIFQPFVKNDLKIEANKARNMGDVSKVKVTFLLRDRDNIIKGQELIDEANNIPRSMIEFKGC